ncbi:MAG: histidine kinase [Albidovulum sp.]
MVVTMLGVGLWVSSKIEQAVVQNSAVAAASYMESFISPLSQDLASSDTLSEPAIQAIEEIFSNTTLSDRVVSYKIWKSGGLIVQASDPALIGQTFEPSEDLRAAWNGQVAASFEDLNDLEDHAEASLGVPLLEVYSPVRETWSGRVIAVAEFYERADILERDLSDASRKSWLIVGSAFLASGLLLFGVVQAGGKTIQDQRIRLQDQLRATEALATQNNALRRRAITASSRATAQTERAIRRIGSDLHDGPAQHLSLVALRLDAALKENQAHKSVDIRNTLNHALDEIRAISRGLSVPDLDRLDLPSLVRRATSENEKQTGMTIKAQFAGNEPKHLGYAEKLCIYRFLQEGLSNAFRHGHVTSAQVQVTGGISKTIVEIVDRGTGFDPNLPREVKDDSGQGLLGLIDRAESIGGSISIESALGKGTRLTLLLADEV